MSGALLRDSEWVKNSFLVTSEQLSKNDQQKRFYSSASQKFTDTTPGGNFAINPPPQFTRHADPKASGQFIGNQQSSNQTGNGDKGMGRYYSEAIDDNGQLIYMRFGVPQYNSLTTFFTGFYNTGAGQLARTGRSTNAFYTLGQVTGFVISIFSPALLTIHLLGVAARAVFQKPSSKFYYLKPAMPLYWNAVTTMVNHIAVNKGIIPKVFDENTNRTLGGNYEFDDSALKQLHELLPDVFKEKGGIDVYAMANRAMRLSHQRQLKVEQASEMTSRSGLGLSPEEMYQALADAPLSDVKKGSNLTDYLKRWVETGYGKSKPEKTQADNGTTAPTTGTAPVISTVDAESLGEAGDKEPEGLWNFFKAELEDGAAFATFRVNSTGHINESFSNSVTESELSTKINGMSSSSRSAHFSLANGNLDGGVIGKVLGAITKSVADFGVGVLEYAGFSGLAALNGAAFVDIPKHWQSSSASLPRANYTISLVSPYGNPVSQLINLYVPLCMILAGGLPLSTGKQSYTSPFLVELYDRGRCQTRLGMIDSISITRGTGNLGFNNEGNAMGIEVSFSIVDMSSILHMPIAEGFSSSAIANGAIIGGVAGTVLAGPLGTVAGTAGGAAVGAGITAVQAGLQMVNDTFDEDTVFSDYMAVLGGMGLSDQIYSWKRLKLNLTRNMANWDSWTSKAHFASFLGDTAPSKLWSVFWKGKAR